MFGSIKQFFGMKPSKAQNIVDPRSERVGDYIIAATSNLVLRKVFYEKTKMAPILNRPEMKQYIAGTLLNVLSYSCPKGNETMEPLSTDVILAALTKKLGEYCQNGYRNVDAAWKAFEESDAPLPKDSPISSRCIVAEICIDHWLHQKIPSNEFDVFRREYFNVAEQLYEDVISDGEVESCNRREPEDPATTKFVCPECGATISVMQYSMIDVSKQPDLKQQIIDQTLFNYKCPKCSLSGALSYDTFYVDDSKKLAVHLVSNKTDADEFRRSGFYERMKKVYGSYICRSVCSVDQLRETIKIVEDGLDDYTINKFKLALVDNWEESKLKNNDIFNYYSNEFNLVYSHTKNGGLIFKYLDERATKENKFVVVRGWKDSYDVCCRKLQLSGIENRGEFVHCDAKYIARITQDADDEVISFKSQKVSAEWLLLFEIFGDAAFDD